MFDIYFHLGKVQKKTDAEHFFVVVFLELKCPHWILYIFVWRAEFVWKSDKFFENLTKFHSQTLLTIFKNSNVLNTWKG